MSEPPYNLEAEESVLGAMMLSNPVIDKVLDVMEPNGEVKFFRASHGVIYRAIRGLQMVGKPVDPIAVVGLLEAKGALEEANGSDRVYEIASLVPAAANAAHHAKIVVETWKRREVIGALTIALSDAHSEPDADKALANAEQMALDLRGKIETGHSTVSNAFELAEEIDHRLKHPRDASADVPSPWTFAPSLRPGNLYVLSGYQADGKTVQASHFTASAVAGKKRVGFATLEMTKSELAERMVASLGAPARALYTGRVPDAQRAAVSTALGKFAMWGPYFEVGEDLSDVPALARFQARGRYDLLIVDHLHQFPISDPRAERVELDNILRHLKLLALRANIPILLLCQLTRTGDPKKPFPRPTMASLRGTAMIESLASVVWFVWRERDSKQLPTEKAEFICAKNRHGFTGSSNLLFHPREVRFTEVRREETGVAENTTAAA